MTDIVLGVGAFFGGVVGLLTGVVVIGLVMVLLMAPYFAQKTETDNRSKTKLAKDNDFFSRQY